MSNDSLIKINNLTAGYGDVTVLDNFSLTLKPGQIFSLLGPSGCGKTTALKAISGLIPTSSGEISLSGKVIQNKHKSLPPHARDIAFIFQDYALFPHLTVFENVAYGLRDLNKADTQARVAESLKLVELKDLDQRYPHELSGGQQQRVAVARALATRPKILLMDEPFSNIDTQVKTNIIQELREILIERNIASICVTHSKEEAFAVSDKVALMHQGCIQQIDKPQELCLKPQKRWVAEFLQTGNIWPASETFWPISNISKPTENQTNTRGGWFFLPHFIELNLSDKNTNICLKSQYFSGSHHVYRVNVDCHEWVIHSHIDFKIEPGQALDLIYHQDIWWIDN